LYNYGYCLLKTTYKPLVISSLRTLSAIA